MPIPKSSMGACMHHLKHKEPGGFGKVKDKHKQRVAICMKQTGESKKTDEGLTFKEYLESL